MARFTFSVHTRPKSCSLTTHQTANHLHAMPPIKKLASKKTSSQAKLNVSSACTDDIRCAAGQCVHCSGSDTKNPIQHRVLQKLLEKLKNRERKRFNQISVDGKSAHLLFALQFSMDVSDVACVLAYWRCQSALQPSGLSDLISEKMYSRTNNARSPALSLTIWDLRGLIRHHVELYPGTLTPQGCYRPPLIITAADVLLLTMPELTVLHRKSCRKLASFCVKAMTESISAYRASAAVAAAAPSS